MTGNTKVWRAPLAGLASVAMLATMGLVAGTANAAAPTYQYPDVNVTLDANGGKFLISDYSGSTSYPDANNAALQSSEKWNVSDDASSVTVTDARNNSGDGYKYADGVFPVLYTYFGKAGVVQYDAKNSRVFSGWYTEKQGGQAVDPTSALADGTTLYAHWSVNTTAAPEVVTVKTNGVVNYADQAYGPDGYADVITRTAAGTYAVRLAAGDTLADWELPSNDVVGDHRVFDETQWAPSSAKGGDTLSAKTVPGTTVKFNPAGADGSTYELYKDGKKIASTSGAFVDVKANGNLGDYQAVVGSGDHKLANAFTLTAGGNSQVVTDNYHLNEGITLNTANDLTLTPKGGQPSVVYVAHKKFYTTSLTDAQQFFVPSGQSFEGFFGKTLDDAARPNTTFLGWYDWAAADSRGILHNSDYFDYNLIERNNVVANYADPAPYDFSTPVSDTTHVVNLYAGYKADAAYTTITLDPNYSGAEKISQKIYVGKKIADQLPTVTRPGYTLVGWYNVPNPADLKLQKLDTSKVATAGVPGFGTYYAVWQADSLYGVNGLLSYLSRGYATKQDTTGKLSFATPYGEPVKVSDPFKLGKKSGYTNAVKTSDGFTETNATLNFFVLAQPAGYNEASWKSFLTTREQVVSDLKADLKLAKHADIAAVYKAATKLTDAKADQYAQKFSGKLVANTAYPDVNYDDYGTHSPEITYLTNLGIVKGYADGTFGYGAPLARVDYIVWLYRAAGSPAVDAQAPFSDVTVKTVPNEEFRKAIAWAKAEGVTTGYADGTFAPYATLNRQDAAAFLYRAAGSPKFNESYADVKFSDVTAGDSANHSQAVLWAASNGIAKGYSGTVNKFSGYSTLVRQDAAAFLARTLQAGYIAK